MSQPTSPSAVPVTRLVPSAVLGGVLGALQPPLLALVAFWMNPGGPGAPTEISSALLFSLRYAVASIVAASAVGAFTRAAYVRLGRDALLPITLTYAFISTAMLLFLFLSPR
jgi:hypothetical protein